MSKKKVFNEVETKFLVTNKDLAPATLAKQLNTTVELVVEFLDTLPKSKKLFEHMIGKNGGSVVMTQAASQLTDGKKKSHPSHQDCIHKPKG
jgi:hypothetical protein